MKKIYLAIALVVLIPVSLLLAENYNDKSMLYSVLELIKTEYVKETSDKKLVESAMSGILSGLDPHSRFLNEKEFEDMKITTKGEFGGIGIEMVIENAGIKVITPIDDTPAYKAGIRPGDVIYSINDELIMNMSSYDAVTKMRGNKGSKVKIGIARAGVSEPIEITLTRDTIKSIPVKHHLYDDIGYIRIASFSEKTTEGVLKAIKDITSGNKKIKGYVLDLRSNPGGLLDQAVNVADLFLDSGIIVSAKGKGDKLLEVFKAKTGDIINNIPLVVLINNGSASAPEIVAGALQENKRAVILGTKSFGKGSIQKIIPIPGYGAISLTIALYYTPLGKSIQADGIMPDIIAQSAKIELIENKENKIQLSESKLKNHLKNPNEDAYSNIIKIDKNEIWKKLYEQDYQLARAIDVLKSIQVLQKWH